MLGNVIILNGVPRAGKSSIAKAIQDVFAGPWLNLGLDAFKAMTASRYQPGVGLRPGGERPDLEEFVAIAYAAMYESIAAHSRLGLHVVADDGIHDSYSRPLGILTDCAHRLHGLPVLFVGVRCPHDEVVRRRAATGWAPVPDEVIRRFDEAIHAHGRYDLEIDTARTTPEESAARINQALHTVDRSVLHDLAAP